ncbi:MAG: LCP family protein [Ruminococcus sp.]|nr:LCP family protein [Ruminococcus sp.]
MSTGAKKKKKKKRSQAPIALVYFLALCVCLVVVGGTVLTLFRNNNILNFGAAESGSYEGYTSKDCTTMLFARVNAKNVLHDLVIYRLDPTKDKLYIVPITSYTYDETTGMTLKQALENGGMPKLTETVERCYNIDIDRYMTVSNAAFQNFCDQLGGYTYTAPEDLYYLAEDSDNDSNDVAIKSGSTQTLMGKQIRLVMTYPVFKEGRQGNIKFMASALETMLKNAFALPDSTKGNLDIFYNILKKKSDTDFEAEEYTKMKSVLSDMLDRNVSPVIAYTPTGTWSDDEKQFFVASAFKDELAEQFTPAVVAKSDSSES